MEITDEIVTTARDLELEMNKDDTEELIMKRENPTTKELQELLDEVHQETQRDVSSSEKEDICYERSFEELGEQRF
ncbi:hypothetical protein QLX08_010327 [Tetragonisca angustula]|uniref:Uncharacterized protein n=1 Tax=Tetragonisca angustula TaxID=166442 RepID=A0AAW0ZCV4_9HYME